MNGVWSFACALIVWTLLSLVSPAFAGETQREAQQALAELSKGFSDSVQVRKHPVASVEFCPDNTCESFDAKDTKSMPVVVDFAYLYIYYFSEYYALADWRKTQSALQIAQRILMKPSYSGCTSETERESARCVLRKYASEGVVRAYYVRYDEKERHKTVNKLAVIFDGK